MSVCKFRWLCVCLPRATFLDAATKLRLPGTGGSRAAARKNHKPSLFTPLPASVFKSETAIFLHFSRAVERCKFQAATRCLWGG